MEEMVAMVAVAAMEETGNHRNLLGIQSTLSSNDPS